MWVVLALLVGKFALTVFSYATGAPGGIFAPMLVIGALTGLLFGQVTMAVAPTLGIAPAACAVIGMAALFASSVRAPITGVVLVVEMTGNYEQLYALIIASLLAYLVAERFREKPIYEELMERDLRKPDPAGGEGLEPVVAEIHVEPLSYMDGRQVDDLALPPECALVSILRGSAEIQPHERLHVKAGDVLVLLAESDNAHVLHAVANAARTSTS